MQNAKEDKLMSLSQIIKDYKKEGNEVQRSIRKKIMRMIKDGKITSYASRDVLVEHNKRTGGATDIFDDIEGHNWLNAPLFKRSEILAILDKKA